MAALSVRCAWRFTVVIHLRSTRWRELSRMTRIGCDSANCKRTNLVPPCNSERVKINFAVISINTVGLEYHSHLVPQLRHPKRERYVYIVLSIIGSALAYQSLVCSIPNLQIIDYFIFIFIHFPSSSIFHFICSLIFNQILLLWLLWVQMICQRARSCTSRSPFPIH